MSWAKKFKEHFLLFREKGLENHERYKPHIEDLIYVNDWMIIMFNDESSIALSDKLEIQPTIPAIPPTPYKGTIADWIVKLSQLGWLPDQSIPYSDIEIPESIWWDILDECEGR